MKTFLFCFTAVTLCIGSTHAQQSTIEDTEVYEAFSEFVTSNESQTTDTHPVPLSTLVEDAFTHGSSFHELELLETEDKSAEKDEAGTSISKGPSPLRVGVVRTMGPVYLSTIDSPVIEKHIDEGQNLWTTAIRSPGATGLRVHFTNFDVGDGTLILYAREGAKVIVRGPFTDKGPDGDGDFWSASLPGDTVFVEVIGIEEPSLNILEIVHFDKMFSQAPSFPLESGEAAALSCELDVMCYSEPSIDTCARQASVQINFQKDGGSYLCSGTILSDLDGETMVPHFLTAYHCLHTQAAVDTLEVVFFWQAGSCGGTLPNYFTLPRINGGTLLATNDTDDGNDMTFIRLPGSLPSGGCFAGWTTADLDSGYGIHHPGGEFKRITFLSDVGFCPGCTFCGDPSDYDYFDIDGGIIEGGSSGSGIFNYSGQLTGQLYGDCCLYASCSGESLNCGNKDAYVLSYGEFDTTYSYIRRWLEIGGTINVNAAYSGGVQEGTPSRPFKVVSTANALAWDGVRVKIIAGSYPEAVRFTTAQTLLAEGGTVVIGR